MARRRGLGSPPPAKTFWQRYQWFIIGGIALFFVITVVAPALTSQPEEEEPQQTDQTGNANTIPGELHFANQGRDHIPTGQRARGYNSDPPTSGEHWSQPGVAPASWGIYDQLLPDEVLVHNLEHGGIVIYYRPTVAPSVVSQLMEFVQNQPNYPAGYILAPRSSLPADITLSAWEYYLPIFQYNEQMMRSFISAHYDQGPEGLSGGP